MPVARKQKGFRQSLYGTKQVADILQVPEWRVKNFSQGEAYRLPPSIQLGRGRGSRRLYDWKDVCRIAIANNMTNLGLAPEAVGKAIKEIPESKLVESKWTSGNSLALVRTTTDDWYVEKASEVKDLIPLNSRVIIPFQQIIHDLEYDHQMELLRKFGGEEE